MSRLFYASTTHEKGDITQLNFEVEQQTNNAKRYAEKVAKLIPSEIVAGYIALINLIPLVKIPNISNWLYPIVFLLCLILTPLYLNVLAEKKRPKRNHLIISSISFIIWAYCVSGNIIIPKLYDSAISSMLLIAFTLISGVIPLKK